MPEQKDSWCFSLLCSVSWNVEVAVELMEDTVLVESVGWTVATSLEVGEDEVGCVSLLVVSVWVGEGAAGKEVGGGCGPLGVELCGGGWDGAVEMVGRGVGCCCVGVKHWDDE